MTIVELENMVKVALKNGESNRVMILRGLVNRIKMLAKNDRNREVTEQDIMTSIQKAIKEVNETRDIYVSRNVPTDAQDAELAILNEFLPKQMSDTELEAVIANIVTEVKQTHEGKLIGPVMNLLKMRHQGSYDPKMASQMVNAALTI